MKKKKDEKKQWEIKKCKKIIKEIKKKIRGKRKKTQINQNSN